jgi:hypothetical protein
LRFAALKIEPVFELARCHTELVDKSRQIEIIFKIEQVMKRYGGLSSRSSSFPLLLIIYFILVRPDRIMAQEAIPDSIVAERIRCIQAMLVQDKKGADIWWYGWLAGYGAATLGQGAVYHLSENSATKQDMALGAATTFLGAVSQLVAPLHPGGKARLLKAMPESTPAERVKKLAVAEEYLRSLAQTEKFGRSWKNHALFGAVNLGSGLITWIGFKRSVWDGIGNFALNTIVSELQIWTQPTRSLKNYQNYGRLYPSGTVPQASKPGPVFSLGAVPGGIGIRVAF